jgi:hypothetical protein
MLEVSFDAQGLVHHEFIPEGCIVNREMYVEILCTLRDTVRRNVQKYCNELVVFSAQQSLVVKKYLSMHNVTAECKWF